MLCYSENEWIYYIDKLISDKSLREKMSKEAREYIKRTYNIKANAHLWEEAYTNL